MADDKLLIRIQKLIAMRDGAAAVGNQAEAEAFAAKVQEIMLRHKIEMTDVELARQQDEDPIGRTPFYPREHGRKDASRRIGWQENLASAVARAHFCRILVTPGTNYVTFVGRASDRAVAVWMFTTLANTAEKLADKATREHRKTAWSHDRHFRSSFLHGFVSAVRRRYAEERKRTEATTTERGVALIRLADTAVTEYYEGIRGGTAASVGGTARSHSGYDAGRQAGQSVSLDSRGVSSGNGAPRQLGQ